MGIKPVASIVAAGSHYAPLSNETRCHEAQCNLLRSAGLAPPARSRCGASCVMWLLLAKPADAFLIYYDGDKLAARRVAAGASEATLLLFGAGGGVVRRNAGNSVLATQTQKQPPFKTRFILSVALNPGGGAGVAVLGLWPLDLGLRSSGRVALAVACDRSERRGSRRASSAIINPPAAWCRPCWGRGRRSAAPRFGRHQQRIRQACCQRAALRC